MKINGIVILFCVFMLPSIKLVSQDTIACGIMPVHIANSNHPDSIYFDMYGNSYDLYQDSFENLQSSTIIEKGYYKITLVDFDENLIPTIEQFFEDISEMVPQRIDLDPCENPIEPEKVNIIVEQVNLGFKLGDGSPFFYGNYPSNQSISGKPFITNAIYEKINGGKASKPLPADAIIKISSFYNWRNKGENTPNTYDLYSILMHYMMHILASHTLFQVNETNMDYFVLYDKYFHQIDIVPNPNDIEEVVEHDCIINKGQITDWTQRHIDFEQACDDPTNPPFKYSYFGLGSTIISPYYDLPPNYSDPQNELEIRLKHFPHENCDPLNWNPGSIQHASYYVHLRSDERDMFSDIEKQVLCQVGYKVAGFCDGCYVIPYDDYTSDIENPSPYLPEEHCCYKEYTTCEDAYYYIPASDLLCNDVTNDPSGIQITDVFYNGLEQIDLELDIQNQVIEFRAQNSGTYTIHYTSNACDCKMLNSTFQIVVAGQCEECLTTEDQDAGFTAQNLECTVTQFIPYHYNPRALYSWNFGNNITSDEFSPSIDFGTSGTYSVTLTVTDFCGGTHTSTQEVLVDCFQCRCPEGGIHIDATGGKTIDETELDELFNEVNINNLTYYVLDESITCLAIAGELIFNTPNKYYQIFGGKILMQKGSGITVNKEVSLDLIDVNSDGGVQGCTHMWKGITLEEGEVLNATILVSGGLLSVHNSTFQDAQFATNMSNGTSLTLIKSIFLNNNYTVYADCFNSLEDNNARINTFFVGNTLNSNALKPGYSGQFPVPIVKSSTGIYASDCGLITLGFHRLGQLATNKILNHYRGFVFDNTHATVANCQFEDIILGSPTKYPDGIGIGVYNGGSLRLSDSGFKRNWRYGVNIENSTLFTIKRNKFSNLPRAIRFSSTMGTFALADPQITLNTISLNVLDNTLPTDCYGISFDFNGRTKVMKIINNSITFNQAPTYGLLNGIYINNHNRTDSDIQILNNDISFPEFYATGIQLRNVQNVSVLDNEIEFKDPLTSGGGSFGILLGNIMNSRISDNTISSEYAESSSKGLVSTLSPDNYICCNNIFGFTTGTEFNGANDIANKFTNNSLSNDIDLRVTDGTIIGQQRFMNNTFSDEMGHARNENSNFQNIEDSEFIIQDCTFDVWPLVIYPTQDCDDMSGNWFYQINPNEGVKSCSQVSSSCREPAGSGTNPLLDYYSGIIDGEYNSGSFGEGLQRELERDLYRALLQNPSLVQQDSSLQIFIDSIVQTSSGKLANTWIAFDSTLMIPDTVFSAIAIVQNQIISWSDSLDILDSIILKTTSTNDHIALLIQRNALLDTISILYSEISDILGIYNQVDTLLLDSLLTGIHGISSTNVLDLNEIEVLELLLKNVRHSYSSIDSVTLITMKTIANQCPKTGGRAVLIARGILEIVESNYYDDDLLCGIPLLKPIVETVIEVTEKHEMTSIRIFPNPASQEVNLEILENSDQTLYSVELLDWNGRVLRHQNELYPGLYTFSVENLPNGLYFLRVHTGKHESNMYKLMIMR